MKAYRIVTYIVDFEDSGLKEILYYLTNIKHMPVEVGAIQEVDIGEWDDDHPLNHKDSNKEAYFEERLK